MQLVSVRCPRCGASLEVEDSLETFYCKYCGEKVILADQSKEVIKAKVKFKEMEYKDKRFTKKFEAVDRFFNPDKYLTEEERIQKKKEERRSTRLLLIFVILTVLAYVLPIVSCKRASKNQEEQLRNTVEQIQVDISNGDYASARIKASTLHYTEEWDSSLEDDWDEIREEILEAIDEAEKKSIENGNG